MCPNFPGVRTFMTLLYVILSFPGYTHFPFIDKRRRQRRRRRRRRRRQQQNTPPPPKKKKKNKKKKTKKKKKNGQNMIDKGAMHAKR